MKSAVGAVGNDAISKTLLKKRVLILAVLRREIERLSTWHNPNNLPGHAVAEETRVRSEKVSRESLRVAWACCPRVAVQLAIRWVGAHVKFQL